MSNGSCARNIRFSRAFRTAQMIATLARRILSHKEDIAFMTGPPDPLHRCPASQFFPGHAVRHGQGGVKGRTLALGAIVRRDPGGQPLSFGLGILRFLGRIPRTLLAPRVLAADAYFLRPKVGRATMTGPVHAHANLLLHPFHIPPGWCFPFARFQRQAVLGEQRPRLLLLKGAAGDSGGGQSWVGIFSAGLRVLDRLLDRGLHGWNGLGSGRGGHSRCGRSNGAMTDLAFYFVQRPTDAFRSCFHTCSRVLSSTLLERGSETTTASLRWHPESHTCSNFLSSTPYSPSW